MKTTADRRWTRSEWCVVAVSPEELRQTGRSWWFHVDREYMAHVGCRARVVVLGWGVAVYGPH